MRQSFIPTTSHYDYNFAKWTAIFFLLTVFSLSTVTSFGQRQYTLLTFQNKKNQKRFRHLHLIQYFNYIKITTTNDSAKWLGGNSVPFLTDSAIIEVSSKDTFSIPLKNIRFIKCEKDYVESVGYLGLGMCMVGYVIGVPVRLIKDGGEAAVEQIIGTTILASLFLPPILIGTIRTKYNMNNWKLISISNEVKKE